MVRRYRTGVGAGGAVPARAFTKPMKKHRWVAALTQPRYAELVAAAAPALRLLVVTDDDAGEPSEPFEDEVDAAARSPKPALSTKPSGG